MKENETTNSNSVKVNTGLWIPVYIWENQELNVMERLVLSKIYHLDNDENGCYANNRYFADYFYLSRTQISKIINSLVTKGYVESIISISKGNKRILKTLPKISEVVLEEIMDRSNTEFDNPIQPRFKHNKEINKKLMKEIIKKNKKKRENRTLARFDFLKINFSFEIDKILKVYRLPPKELEFCKAKYNEKQDSNTLINFENYISNWKSNLKSTDYKKDSIPQRPFGKAF